MQHAQLVNGIKKLTAALESCGIRDALAPGRENETQALLESLRKYAIVASGYTSAEQTVADLLGLSELDSSTAWAKLLTGGPARSHYFDRVGFVTHHLPRFVELLEESSETPPSNGLCVTVVGAERGVSASRLVTIVNAVTSLYRASADLRGMAITDLSLVSVDSGDDTLLWFDAEPTAIGWLKDLLTSAFRWLALYREEHELTQRIQLAKDNLPTIRMIRDLTARGNLTEDEATRLEHDVLVALLAFFDAGALIPEMEADIKDNLREVVSSLPPRHHSSPEFAAVMSEIQDLDDDEVVPPEDSVIELEPSSVEMLDEPE